VTVFRHGPGTLAEPAIGLRFLGRRSFDLATDGLGCNSRSSVPSLGSAAGLVRGPTELEITAACTRRLAGLLIAAVCRSKRRKPPWIELCEHVLVLFAAGGAAVDHWEYVTIDWEHSSITRRGPNLIYTLAGVPCSGSTLKIGSPKPRRHRTCLLTGPCCERQPRYR
jgi:hypothetical protein